MAVAAQASKQREVLRDLEEATGSADAGVGETEQRGSSSLGPLPGLWPRALVVGVGGVLACVVAGALLRSVLCPQCALCQAHASAAAAEGCGPELAAGGPALQLAAGVRWAARWLPSAMQEHVRGLSGVEMLALVASVAVAAVTLGWEAASLFGGSDASPALGGSGAAADAGQAAVAGQPRASGPQVSGARWRAAQQAAAVRVVVLCSSTVLLASMANVNWALAYAVAAALSVPVALSAAHRPADPAERRRVWDPRRLLQALALAATSPPTLAWVAATAAGVPLAADDTWVARAATSGNAGGGGWRALVCCSWPTSYMFVWAALLPCWLCEAWCFLAR